MSFDLRSALEEILLAPRPTVPTVGMKVGARRWPLSGGHPDNWLPPHCGVLLACNDLRVWRRSMLGPEPTQEQIDAHLASLSRQGLLANSVPVLWEFNPEQAMWESATAVVHYDEDVANWSRARMEKGG